MWMHWLWVTWAWAGPQWVDEAPFEATPAVMLEAAADAEHEADDDTHVLLRETKVRIAEDGTSWVQSRLVYEVLTVKGAEDWGHTRAEWSPWRDAPAQIRARVVLPDGGVSWLDESTLGEAEVQPDGHSFSDSRAIYGVIPSLKPGAVVEEVLTWPKRAPLAEGGARFSLSLNDGYEVDLRRVEVEVAQGVPLHTEVFGGEARVRKLRGGRRGVWVELESPAPGEQVHFSPADTTTWPTLYVSTNADWAQVAAAYHGLVAPQADATGLDTLVAELRELSDDAARVDRAFELARDGFRYTSLAFGDAAIVPATPAEVLARGYGDCKDKALFMHTLLREVGIETRLMLVRRGRGLDVHPEVPGLEGFNHAILHAPTVDAYYDPTDRRLGRRELASDVQGRLALQVTPGGELVRLPSWTAEDHTYREERSFRFDLDGGSSSTEVTTATGWPARSLRNDFLEYRTEEGRKYLGSYFSENYGLEMTELELDGDTPGATARLQLSGSEPSVGLRLADELSVGVSWAGLLMQGPEFLYEDEAQEWLEGREADIQLLPYRSEVVWRAVVPDGFELVQGLEDVLWRGESGTEVSRTFTETEDGVEVRFVVDSGDARWSAEEAREMRRVVLEQLDGGLGWEEMLWAPASDRLLEAGRVAEAVAELRALADAHPEEPLYQAWLGELLGQIGLVELAEQQTEAAVAKDEDSGVLWAHLAFVRSLDAVGVRFGIGFPRDETLAAYDEAIQRVDAAPRLRMLRAETLLHEPRRGFRLAEGARIDEALDVFLEVEGELGVEPGPLWTDAFLAAGRPEESLRLAEELPSAAERGAAAVKALCAMGRTQEFAGRMLELRGTTERVVWDEIVASFTAYAHGLPADGSAWPCLEAMFGGMPIPEVVEEARPIFSPLPPVASPAHQLFVDAMAATLLANPEGLSQLGEGPAWQTSRLGEVGRLGTLLPRSLYQHLGRVNPEDLVRRFLRLTPPPQEEVLWGPFHRAVWESPTGGSDMTMTYKRAGKRWQLVDLSDFSGGFALEVLAQLERGRDDRVLAAGATVEGPSAGVWEASSQTVTGAHLAVAVPALDLLDERQWSAWLEALSEEAEPEAAWRAVDAAVELLLDRAPGLEGRLDDVVAAVGRRQDAEVDALLALAGARVWAARNEPARAPDLLAVATDTPWLRRALAEVADLVGQSRPGAPDTEPAPEPEGATTEAWWAAWRAGEGGLLGLAEGQEGEATHGEYRALALTRQGQPVEALFELLQPPLGTDQVSAQAYVRGRAAAELGFPEHARVQFSRVASSERELWRAAQEALEALPDAP